jgi:hypothetical protein
MDIDNIKKDHRHESALMTAAREDFNNIWNWYLFE